MPKWRSCPRPEVLHWPQDWRHGMAQLRGHKHLEWKQSAHNILLFRFPSASRLSCAAVLKRRVVLLPSSLLALRILCKSLSILPVAATVRGRLRQTAPYALTVMEPTSVAYVSVIPAASAQGASVQWRTTAHLMMSTASRKQTLQSAMGEATACADSAPATVMSLVKCGGSTASVTTSTACASEANCAPVSCFTYVRYMQVPPESY